MWQIPSLNARRRALLAGGAGAVVALGVAELLHGLSDDAVPSVLAALGQRVIELVPGGLATRAIEALGGADIPFLVFCLICGSLAAGALLSLLSLRHPAAALAGVAGLWLLGCAAALAEPSAALLPTAAALLLALTCGAGASRLLLRAGRSPRPAAHSPPATRRREAGAPGTELGRRNFVLLAGAAVAAGAAAGGAGRLLASREAPPEAARPLRLPEGRPSGDGAGHRTLPPPPETASIEAPGMPPLITPAGDFYLIDTALISPRVDVREWSLRVGGAVKNPLELSYSDLLSMPIREADITLSCVSNEVGGGLVSNGRWTGVLLSDVLREAGVDPGRITDSSAQIVGRSVDGWTAGFRTELAFDGREALVAFGLNGSELPLEHGYPARLVVPGLYGYVSATKWLSEIELTDWDFDAYWIQRGWAKEGPVKIQSRIDTVRDGETLPAGKIPVGGVAWAPHRGISRVEVSTDGGETWHGARLAAQLDPDSWRQYLYEWDARPGEYTLQVRATDGEGRTQTARKTPPHPSGATGYHTLRVAVL
ncbi:sulfite oxidase [Rubrobacter xylanophilus]|uniref:sulfite oxidase n=1 Tax=Rubrobacter xylanophilus TaxID=49319 RepID=UPI00117A6E07|nr:sulfite oxidase [Rubrobacter xylanophilus]